VTAPTERRTTTTTTSEEGFATLAQAKEAPRQRGAMKRKRCGVCPGCLAPECGNCRYCLDMKKRGGSGTLRRPCEMRGCVATSSGEVREAVPYVPFFFGDASVLQRATPLF